MIKVGVVGGPCSGKSTLIRGLVNELGLRGLDARQVSVEYDEEWPRRHIRETGAPECEFEEYLMQSKIMEKEAYLVSTGCDIVICDSTSFAPYVYAVRYRSPHKASKRHKILQELHARALEHKDSYDIIFFVTSVPAREDGVRFNVRDSQAVADQI